MSLTTESMRSVAIGFSSRYSTKDFYRRDNVSTRLSDPIRQSIWVSAKRSLIRDHLGYYREESPGIAGVHDRINTRSSRYFSKLHTHPYGTRRSRRIYPDRDPVVQTPYSQHGVSVWFSHMTSHARVEVIRLCRIGLKWTHPALINRIHGKRKEK